MNVWDGKDKHRSRRGEGEGDKGNWVHVVWARCCNDSVVKLKSRGRRVREGRRENDGQEEWERRRKMIKGGGWLGKETFLHMLRVHVSSLSFILPTWFFVLYVMTHVQCDRPKNCLTNLGQIHFFSAMLSICICTWDKIKKKLRR